MAAAALASRWRVASKCAGSPTARWSGAPVVGCGKTISLAHRCMLCSPSSAARASCERYFGSPRMGQPSSRARLPVSGPTLWRQQRRGSSRDAAGSIRTTVTVDAADDTGQFLGGAARWTRGRMRRSARTRGLSSVRPPACPAPAHRSHPRQLAAPRPLPRTSCAPPSYHPSRRPLRAWQMPGRPPPPPSWFARRRAGRLHKTHRSPQMA